MITDGNSKSRIMITDSNSKIQIPEFRIMITDVYLKFKEQCSAFNVQCSKPKA